MCKRPTLINIQCRVFRCYDVLSLYQDRPNNIRSRGRLDSSYESVLRDAARKAGIPAHRRIRDAGYILQLWAESADGQVHGEGKVIRSLRNEHLRNHRRRLHRRRSDRFAALSLGARDTEKDRIRKIQLNILGCSSSSSSIRLPLIPKLWPPILIKIDMS